MDEGIAGIEKRQPAHADCPFKFPEACCSWSPMQGPMTVVELHARVVRRRRLDRMMYGARLLRLLY